MCVRTLRKFTIKFALGHWPSNISNLGISSTNKLLKLYKNNSKYTNVINERPTDRTKHEWKFEREMNEWNARRKSMLTTTTTAMMMMMMMRDKHTVHTSNAVACIPIRSFSLLHSLALSYRKFLIQPWKCMYICMHITQIGSYTSICAYSLNETECSLTHNRGCCCWLLQRSILFHIR